MTLFQTILARLCAASGETLLHVDTPSELLQTIDADRLKTLTDALGSENVEILAREQEVQVLMSGTPAQAESSGHIRLMQVIKALVDFEGSSAMLVTGSGKLTTWKQGESPVLEHLDDDLLAQAFTRRVGNTMPAAAE